MDGSATVFSIDALRTIRTDLHQFEEHADATISALLVTSQQTLHFLEDRLNERIGRVRSCEHNLTRAEDSLRHCESSGDGDTTPDCSSEESDVRLAQHRLEVARQELARTQRALASYRESLGTFHAAVCRVREAFSTDVPAASSFLARLLDTLNRYVLTPAPGQLAKCEAEAVGLDDRLAAAHAMDRHFPPESHKYARQRTAHTWFGDKATGRRVVAHVLREKSGLIDEWLGKTECNTELVLAYDGSGNEVIGQGVFGKPANTAPTPEQMVSLTAARIVLKKGGWRGWHVHTAYPVPTVFRHWGRTRSRLADLLPRHVDDPINERLPLDLKALGGH